MVIKKKKENKLTVRPSEMKGDITNMRPLDIWSEMDRMFDNFRTNFDDLFWPWSERTQPSTYLIQKRTPPMDIIDKGDHYEMKLEIPGIPKDKIDIQVTPTGIEVKGECDENKEIKDKRWLRRECSSMSFYRSLELPEELKTEDVDAELKEGVLTIKLPKVTPKTEEKPKKIKIK